MNTTWTDLAWIDLHGRLRSVTVPADRVADAVAAVTIDPADTGWRLSSPPLRLAPDTAARYRSPWEEGRDVVLCDLVEPDGRPSPLCTRTLLRETLALAAERGFDVVAAAELEFFLARPDGAPVYETVENYGIVAGAAYEPVLGAIRRFRAAGVPVVATNPEYGGGQFEVNLHHGDALAAADAVVVLRAWVGAEAARAGLRARFGAKPWAEGSGSGMHVHHSLWHDGRNAFWDDGALSETGRGYLAGLLEGIAPLTVLGSPSATAYHRRSDGSFCPTAACWGGDNRTVAVRVLTETEPATRIEQRDASADANLHLALAGQLAAGLDGIARGLEPPPPVTGNAYARTDLPPLPRTLADAVGRFADAPLAVRLLGEGRHEALAAQLREEAESDLAGLPVEVWR